MTVIIVKMDTANYVNKIGKQINDSTKYRAHLDRTSITNLILINHTYTMTEQLEHSLSLAEPKF